MKIKCIDNNGRFPLTIGKEYEVIYSNSEHYNLRNDDGNQGCYNKDRFEIVEELPEKWVLKHDNQQEMFDWLNLNSTNGITRYSGKILQYLYYPDLEGSHHYMRKDLSSGYKEISYETFEKLVLNKKIIGYKVPMNLYNGYLQKGTVLTLDMKRGDNEYKYSAGAFDAYVPAEIVETWVPVYEEEKITIGSYTMEIKNGKAAFGCQEFTKEELLAYKRLYNKELKGDIVVLGIVMKEEIIDKIIAQL